LEESNNYPSPIKRSKTKLMSTTDKETAFAERVRPYENKWVALVEKEGEDFVVGSGTTPTEALTEAKKNGFATAILFSVPSFSDVFAY
jgi:hypothetical protein